MDGRLVSRAEAETLAHFTADLCAVALQTFNSAFPHRIAYKLIYSQQNPEKDWGKNVLDSVRFAFWALNEEYSAPDVATGKKLRTIVPDNTTVIASSVSNGGTESLQAAKQDSEGLIDCVAVAEPNAQPGGMSGVTVTQGGTAVPNAGKPLIDYFTYRMLYKPCAAILGNAQAPNGTRLSWFGFGTAPLGNAFPQVGEQELHTLASNRCQSLADKGLAMGATTADLANDALNKMRADGWMDIRAQSYPKA
jgi:hydroxybutyrate-dimer hydrolase